ncbi:MAG TPA: prolipoprotein diacylglyceryl transferase family protein [Puia sp.]|nr:prolipoprotein diacylglyceryl transferase family protein [Puia sp.]
MYPNLYYAFKDLFHVDWGFLKFVNSFGFFVALAFIGAAVTLSMELKRRERDGLLNSEEQKIIVGKPASLSELLINFVIGFLLGYKFVGFFIANRGQEIDPRQYMFSSSGNLIAGLLVGGILVFLKYREKSKSKLKDPEERVVRIWPHDRVGDMTFFAFLFGFLGAKLFDILESPSDFIESIRAVNRGSQDFASIIFSGLTFYGGLICAALAIWVYARKHHIGFWELNDSAAPGLMLSYAIGRIGCQVSGDGDWGIENMHPKPISWLPEWMWSYHYPHNVISKGINIPGCFDAQYCSQLPVGVYPTPFYETVMCLILFAVIWRLRKKFTIPGTLFAFYLILNGVERFFIEKIRVNVKYDFLGIHPTQAEIISFLLVIIGAVLWIWLKKRKIAGTNHARAVE